MSTSKAIGILQTLAPFVEGIPVVGTELAAVVGLAERACQSAEEAKANREMYRQLAQEIATYAAAVSRAAQSSPHLSSAAAPDAEGASESQQASWVGNIHQLTSIFSEVVETIDKRRAEDDKRGSQFMGKMRRKRYNIWHKDDDKEQVERLRERIEEAVRSFHIEGEIWELGALDRIQKEIKDAAARQEAIAARQVEQLKAVIAPQTEGIQQTQHYQQFIFIEQRLKPVPGSRFGEEGIPNGCLPRTREQLMAQLRVWANDNSESCPAIFGLTGLAGTGKTTVAVSFCEEFYQTLPVVTFFISRGTDERRIPTRIIHTIAYQLGTRQVTAGTVISKALSDGRDIVAQSLAEQVKALFTAPLQALEGSPLPVLVVIDALDECYKINGREGGDLIPLVAAAIRQLPGRVKMLITSREEPEIWKMFKSLRLNTVENSIRLQNIEHTVVESDIKTYYAHHFPLISRNAGFEDETSWPSKASFDLLVALTGRLFVFAALVIRLLSNQRVNPRTRLEEILQTSTLLSGISVFKPLDDLYLAVLEKAVDTGDDAADVDTQERIRILVGALVLLQMPLSSRTISSLLNKDQFLIKKDIEHLSAVLIIPDNPDEPITTFHPSFSDYVQLRCKDERFLVVPEDCHAHLLRRCLAIMDKDLKRDMLQTEDPSIMNSDIKDLEAKRKGFFPPQLRYACEYWLNHLTNAGKLDVSLASDLNRFCKRHLLHWIEALSLLEQLSAAHVGLPGAISQCQQQQDEEAISTASLLGDSERVLKTYDSALRLCALQAYCSVLVFMPECQLYERTRIELIGSIEVKSERLKNWSSVRQTLEGHRGNVYSVACSSDGMRIASGSLDETVRVWDAITGAAIAELNGHSDYVRSVAFSPDGTRIVSGSEDKTVRVWDAITGAAIAKLNGHTHYVMSVAFSPDGTRIISGSSDKAVRVWDAITGAAIAELNGHTHYVTSVAFSPDGTRIVSGSKDKTVRVWDAITGAAIAELNGHSKYVTSVAFSPDGTRIISGSWDKTVRVWDAITGAAIAELNSNTASVTSVWFIEDGSQIVSEDGYGHRRVWHAGKDFPVDSLHSNFTLHKLSTSPATSHISFDHTSGWLESAKVSDGSVKRLCWVPPERRGRLWAFGHLGVLSTDEGVITILQCSGL